MNKKLLTALSCIAGVTLCTAVVAEPANCPGGGCRPCPPPHPYPYRPYHPCRPCGRYYYGPDRGIVNAAAIVDIVANGIGILNSLNPPVTTVVSQPYAQQYVQPAYAQPVYTQQLTTAQQAAAQQAAAQAAAQQAAAQQAAAQQTAAQQAAQPAAQQQTTQALGEPRYIKTADGKIKKIYPIYVPQEIVENGQTKVVYVPVYDSTAPEASEAQK